MRRTSSSGPCSAGSPTAIRSPASAWTRPATFVADGTPIGDRLTETYLTMAAGIPGNDLSALISLVEGMRGGAQPDPADPPRVPVLFATGTEDPILEASKRLAAATPGSAFFPITGRDHFNAPTSREFRERAIAFLEEAA